MVYLICSLKGYGTGFIQMSELQLLINILINQEILMVITYIYYILYEKQTSGQPHINTLK